MMIQGTVMGITSLKTSLSEKPEDDDLEDEEFEDDEDEDDWRKYL